MKVLQCGDGLVTMAEQLIDNKTSNLAECYMSVLMVASNIIGYKVEPLNIVVMLLVLEYNMDQNGNLRCGRELQKQNPER